jgi:acetyltransferase-like isoleucine patch superfamily enzyme
VAALLRYLRYRYLRSLLKALFYKARYGRRADFSPFRVYFGKGTFLEIAGSGSFSAERGDRIWFGDYASVRCLGGPVKIGAGTFFNEACRLVSHVGITIGKNCMFAPNVSILDSAHRFEANGTDYRYQGTRGGVIAIDGNCWFATNTVISLGSTVHHGVVVGANSVVRGVLEAESLYAGSPCRRIRSLKPQA